MVEVLARRRTLGRPVRLLVGGTPCQSFSVAGLRGGMADRRGSLALVYLQLARRRRPAWLVWENVPGVLTSNGGRDFGAFLGGWRNSGMGGPTESWTLSTLEFPSGAVASSLSDILETGALPERYYLSPRACLGIVRRAARRGRALPEHLRRALDEAARAPME
jgi:hypothetical protein